MNKELAFSASRSSGPGGQNVNKVNSKITLMFDVVRSEILTAEEKDVMVKKLASQLTKEGVLILMAQDKRSQLENKEAAIQKLDKLLVKAFAKRKVRKATKPSKTAVQKRITNKKQHSQKKQWRQKPE
ncbi:MAG TPA: alternative ribosome rescue aminoacyl-tRNA hydrolase ArfB [Chryseolinea sp.]|nr:alternative ribosome rescue aminoacyl-tRNA hydrolase ArfB [Chryseolinea sp.]